MIIWLTVLFTSIFSPSWYNRVSVDFMISFGLGGLVEIFIEAAIS